MSIRTALPINTELRFGPDTCFTIKGEAGRGASCIVYDAVYQTNAGDEKIVRIKECCPFDIPLKREPSGALSCPESNAGRFADVKAHMYADFRLCNRLFYTESSSDAIINTLNIYEANNTVYIVSAWARENVLSSIKLDSLREHISIVRQTAAAIRSIHQAGYLYLDIKPDNISVINSISKRVQLFDFDSLVPIESLRNRQYSSHQRLSYTRGFAPLELRRGQLSGLGPHTDVYEVGALLFFLLFGHTPEAPDCVRSAVYDFSAVSGSSAIPDRLVILFTEFFHKTLASFSRDRFSDMDSVVEMLSEMERIADPVYPCLISSPVNSPSCFIGRSVELESLASWAEDESQHVLFITGMGGIGKSTFIRHFLSDHREAWDSIVFLFFRGNLRQTITDDSGLRINGTERLPEETEADYFERKLQKLREIMERDRVLLVIDNFENYGDPALGQILSLPCRSIFISRMPLGSLNLPVLPLGSLSDEDDLLKLFVHYLDRAVEADEVGIIREIIHLVDGHTLALELLARQISNSFLSLSEACELLKAKGTLHIDDLRVDYLRDNHISYEYLEVIIKQLFETNRLSSAEISLLKALTLFPAPGIDAREFMRLSGIDSAEPVSSLVRYGWITRGADRVLYLHPLIRDVIRDFPAEDRILCNVESVLRTLYRDIVFESHKEEINIRDPENIPAELQNVDASEILTDFRKLNASVTAVRGVIDAVSNDAQLSCRPLTRKLTHAMIVNLPRHEDEAILNYGMALLDHPESLTALEILEVYEPVEKVLLTRQKYDKAINLMKRAEKYAVDERTKAEFCGLESNICDFRGEPEDHRKMFTLLEEGITHARLAPPPERKHLLAEFLLGKLNAFTRSGFEDESVINDLVNELMEIIEKECLPYSEIRCGFAIAMGFYWAELGRDREKVDKWCSIAREIGKKLYPAGLDFIDNCVIPPAIMYFDLGDYDDSESALQEGIRICDDHPEIAAYVRKKNDLRHYLQDVYHAAGKFF